MNKKNNRLLLAAAILLALGAGFGLLRGLLGLLALTTVVTMTPARTAPEWTASHGARWLTGVLHDIKPMLPRALADHLRV